MKQFRKTVFWFIALIVIGGVFFLTDDRVEEAQRVEEANLMLVSFDVEDVAEFWITAADEGVRARAVKDKDGWWLAEPLRAKGDAEAIGNMLKNILKSRKDGILFEDPEPSKLKELGLDAPKLEIAFKTASSTVTIVFGDKGPTLNVTYAMFKGDPRVYRIHSDVRTEADTTVYALRDKSTLVIDPLQLSRFEIDRRGKDTVVIVHDRGRWDMIEPDTGRASQIKVLETLYEVKDTPVKAFIDEDPKELDSYGLSAPRITLTVLEKGKTKPQTLRIGDRDRANRGYFAKREGVNTIFTLEESVVKNLLAGKDKWKELGEGT